jgi:hypothetical protein
MKEIYYKYRPIVLLILLFTLIGLPVIVPSQSGEASANLQGKPPVAAFYTGQIRVSKAQIRVDMSSEQANIEILYTLDNLGKIQEETTLDFYTSIDALSIRKPYMEDIQTVNINKSVDIPINYSQPISGDKLRGFKLNPQLLFNNLHSMYPVGEYTITVLLPTGVPDLIKMSLPPYERALIDGRVSFTWSLHETYFSSLEFAWSTITTVKIVKQVPIFRPKDGEIEVRLSVTNIGEAGVKGVLLEENFNVGDIEPIDPLSAFNIVTGDPNDIRLIWRHIIDVLAPQQTIDLSYKVKIINLATEQCFSATQALFDGNLVGLSNVVCVKQSE